MRAGIVLRQAILSDQVIKSDSFYQKMNSYKKISIQGNTSKRSFTAVNLTHACM